MKHRMEGSPKLYYILIGVLVLDGIFLSAIILAMASRGLM